MSTSKTFCAIEIYSRHTYRAKRLIAAIYSNFDHVRPFIVVDGAMWTLFKGEKKNNWNAECLAGKTFSGSIERTW